MSQHAITWWQHLFVFIVRIRPCMTQFKLLYKLFFFFLAAQRNHFSHKLLYKSCPVGRLASFSTFLWGLRDEQGCWRCSHQHLAERKAMAWPGRSSAATHWVSMVHVRLPITLCKNGRSCAIAQLGRNSGTVRRGRGTCADPLPANSTADYGAGTLMWRGGTAMSERCWGQHGEGVTWPWSWW